MFALFMCIWWLFNMQAELYQTRLIWWINHLRSKWIYDVNNQEISIFWQTNVQDAYCIQCGKFLLSLPHCAMAEKLWNLSEQFLIWAFLREPTLWQETASPWQHETGRLWAEQAGNAFPCRSGGQRCLDLL